MTKMVIRPQEISDLSLLSLLAAHELDRLNRHQPSEARYISALREHLAEQVGDPAHADIKNIAPSTVQLYRRAVHAATRVDPPDFTAFVSELGRLMNQLQLASETASSDQKKISALGDLNPLLAFVISLHGQLLAQKQRLAASRSSNRYRV